MGKKLSRAEMTARITQIAKDCGQTHLDSFCGKYFNLMYDPDSGVVVESLEKNNTYGFTEIARMSDKDIRNIYKSLAIDFA